MNIKVDVDNAYCIYRNCSDPSDLLAYIRWPKEHTYYRGICREHMPLFNRLYVYNSQRPDGDDKFIMDEDGEKLTSLYLTHGK